jgi:2Fe-2S ferredoxin
VTEKEVIIFIADQKGNETVVEGQEGRSLMEVIRDNGFTELLALCGGACSCATCHVYVDSLFLDRLPVVGEDEDVLLDSLDTRRPESRLSCQIPLNVALDGLKIIIPVQV